jgi:very-short-patch-repair endonuclease
MPRRQQPRNTARARQLRGEMSLPEVLLWRLLRREPEGIKFRRQLPIGDYVLDFYVARLKLAIEIDGIAHDMGDRPERDATREAFLQAQGIEVVRLPAVEVLRSPEEVAEMLVGYCRSK